MQNSSGFISQLPHNCVPIAQLPAALRDAKQAWLSCVSVAAVFSSDVEDGDLVRPMIESAEALPDNVADWKDAVWVPVKRLLNAEDNTFDSTIPAFWGIAYRQAGRVLFGPTVQHSSFSWHTGDVLYADKQGRLTTTNTGVLVGFCVAPGTIYIGSSASESEISIKSMQEKIAALDSFTLGLEVKVTALGLRDEELDGQIKDVETVVSSKVAALIRQETTPTAAGSTTPRTLSDRFADVINVKDFGAKGDGVTDDTAAIQAVFVYAKGRGPVKVVFPAGTYHIGTAGISICGDVTVDARAAHFTRGQQVRGFFTNALYITESVGGYEGNSNIEWHGGTFHGAGSATSDHFQFFSFGHARNIFVEGCAFYDRCGGAHGIEVASVDTITIENCNFLGYSRKSATSEVAFAEAIQLEHSTPNGFWMGKPDYTPTKNVIIRGCRFAPNPLSGLGADNVAIGGHGAIQTVSGEASVSNVLISDCTFEGMLYTALRNYCFETYTVTGCTFIDCHRVIMLEGVPKASVVREDGSTATKGLACKNVTFEGNTIVYTKANTGMRIVDIPSIFTDDDQSYHENLNFLNNVFQKTILPTDGGYRTAIRIAHGKNILIEGNNFEYMTDIGIYLENGCQDVHVIGNRFCHISHKGIYTPDNSGVVGLYVENNTIYGDPFAGYSIAAIQYRNVDKFTICNNWIETKTPAGVGASYTLNLASNSNGWIDGNTIISDNTNLQDIQATASNMNVKVGKNYFPSSANAEHVNTAHGPDTTTVYSESFILSREDVAPAGILFRNCKTTHAPALAGDGLGSGEAILTFGVADRKTKAYLNLCAVHKSNDTELPSFRPITDSGMRIGSGAFRWSQIFSATAAINTSDAREKTSVTDPNEALMRAWGKVDFKSFQFTDAVGQKGEEARIHFGVIAQQVADAFASEGLDARRYALFCYDKWDDEYEDVKVVDAEAVLDEDGNEVTPAVTHIEKVLVTPAGDRYGIRYSEALALECAYQRWRLSKLEEKMASIF